MDSYLSLFCWIGAVVFGVMALVDFADSTLIESLLFAIAGQGFELLDLAKQDQHG